MSALGIVVFATTSIVGLTLLRGLVLQALWTWFAVETFAAPPVTLVQAIGLSLLVSFLTYQWDARQERDPNETPFEGALAAALAGLFLSGFAYLFGAIVHSFA